MLIVCQVFAQADPTMLTSVLGPGLCRRIQDLGPLDDTKAHKILRVVSGFLSSINVRHKVTIYSTHNLPSFIFLRPHDPFPAEAISDLVSMLVSEEITPPLIITDNSHISELFNE